MQVLFIRPDGALFSLVFGQEGCCFRKQAQETDLLTHRYPSGQIDGHHWRMEKKPIPKIKTSRQSTRSWIPRKTRKVPNQHRIPTSHQTRTTYCSTCCLLLRRVSHRNPAGTGAFCLRSQAPAQGADGAPPSEAVHRHLLAQPGCPREPSKPYACFRKTPPKWWPLTRSPREGPPKQV